MLNRALQNESQAISCARERGEMGKASGGKSRGDYLKGKRTSETRRFGIHGQSRSLADPYCSLVEDGAAVSRGTLAVRQWQRGFQPRCLPLRLTVSTSFAGRSPVAGAAMLQWWLFRHASLPWGP